MRQKKQNAPDDGSNYGGRYWVKVTITASIAGIISWGGITLITSAMKKTASSPPTTTATHPAANNQSTDLTNKNPIKRDSNKLVHFQKSPVGTQPIVMVKEALTPSINTNNSNVLIGPVNAPVNQSINNINEALPPKWSISPSENVSPGVWRSKLSAKSQGNMPYHNWNILLTLNTPVTNRESIEATVGMWMPLKIEGSSLQPNQFFIGFSDFNPSQSFSEYLYSKEPLKILTVDTLSE